MAAWRHKQPLHNRSFGAHLQHACNVVALSRYLIGRYRSTNLLQLPCSCRTAVSSRSSSIHRL